jgi:hypothetical protein
MVNVEETCLLNGHKLIYEHFCRANNNKVNMDFSELVRITYLCHVNKIMTTVLVHVTCANYTR